MNTETQKAVLLIPIAGAIMLGFYLINRATYIEAFKEGTIAVLCAMEGEDWYQKKGYTYENGYGRFLDEVDENAEKLNCNPQ